MTSALSIDLFHDLVAAYGANPERWPGDLRSGAVSCLVASEAARSAWREAAELDADLDRMPGLDLSPEAADRVLAIASASQRHNTGLVSAALRHALPYAAAASVALVIGLSAPSPFRDTVTPSPEVVATIDTPQTVDDSADNFGDLSRLALVDVNAFADDETSASAASDAENLLSELPLL